MGVCDKKVQGYFEPMQCKEEIRQKRKEAYQKAKAKRDADPRYQALKEKIKQDRKAKYQAYRNKIRKEKEAEEQKRRASKDEALKAFFVLASELENEIKQPSSGVPHN